MRNYLILGVFLLSSITFATGQQGRPGTSITRAFLATAHHIAKNIPTKEAVFWNSLCQSATVVFVIPIFDYLGYPLDPKDLIQMTIVRDGSMIGAIHQNIADKRLFPAGGEGVVFDKSHWLAHGTKVTFKFAAPLLSRATGMDQKQLVRANQYLVDWIARYGTMWGAYCQTLDNNNLQTLNSQDVVVRDLNGILSQTDYHTRQNIQNTLFEALPGTLVVVFISDKILDSLKVEQTTDDFLVYVLDWIPGDFSKSVYEQDSLLITPFAAIKLSLKSFSKQVIMNYLFMITHPSIMNAVKAIPDSAYKTAGIIGFSSALVELNHGTISNAWNSISEFPAAAVEISQQVYDGSGQDD